MAIWTPQRRPSWKQGFARSASESAYPNLWKGLQGLWVPALGPTGATLRDVSGHHNHGTLTNMDPAAAWVIGDPRVGGHALDFGGRASNDHLVLARSYTLTEFTFSAWVKRADTSNFHNLFGGGSNTRFFSLNGNTNMLLVADDGATSGDWVSVLPTGVWAYVAVAYSTPIAELWVDAVSQGTKTLIGSKSFVFDFLAANQTPDYEWLGQIAFASLHDRASGDDEVQFLYEQSLAHLTLRRRVYPAVAAAPAGGVPYWIFPRSSQIIGGGVS